MPILNPLISTQSRKARQGESIFLCSLRVFARNKMTHADFESFDLHAKPQSLPR
jgi:hypothetical protein